jgi:hypothetical protein
VEDYSHHIGYVDKGGRMAISYSISHQTWKWIEKLFFHLLDLAILIGYILFLFSLSVVERKSHNGNFNLPL